MIRKWVPENTQGIIGCGSVSCLLFSCNSESWTVGHPSSQVKTSLG